MSRDFSRSVNRDFVQSPNRDRLSEPSGPTDVEVLLLANRQGFYSYGFPFYTPTTEQAALAAIDARRFRRIRISGFHAGSGASKTQTVQWDDLFWNLAFPSGVRQPIVQTTASSGTWPGPISIGSGGFANPVTVTDVFARYESSGSFVEIRLEDDVPHLSDLNEIYSILSGITATTPPAIRPPGSPIWRNGFIAHNSTLILDVETSVPLPLSPASHNYQRVRDTRPGTAINLGSLGVIQNFPMTYFGGQFRKILASNGSTYRWIVNPTTMTEVDCRASTILSGVIMPVPISFFEDEILKGFGSWELFCFPPHVHPGLPYPPASCVP